MSVENTIPSYDTLLRLTVVTGKMFSIVTPILQPLQPWQYAKCIHSSVSKYLHRIFTHAYSVVLLNAKLSTQHFVMSLLKSK